MSGAAQVVRALGGATNRGICTVGLRSCAALALAGVFACGDDTGTNPTDVTFGETTFVVVVNPPVNDLSEATVPPPGSARGGVNVAVAGGPAGVTDATGVRVLAPVGAGNRVISVNDGGNSGEVSVSIAERDLRELAIALDAGGAALMANVGYPFGGPSLHTLEARPRRRSPARGVTGLSS